MVQGEIYYIFANADHSDQRLLGGAGLISVPGVTVAEGVRRTNSSILELLRAPLQRWRCDIAMMSAVANPFKQDSGQSLLRELEILLLRSLTHMPLALHEAGPLKNGFRYLCP